MMIRLLEALKIQYFSRKSQWAGTGINDEEPPSLSASPLYWPRTSNAHPLVMTRLLQYILWNFGRTMMTRRSLRAFHFSPTMDAMPDPDLASELVSVT
jgi:hypothetical protein